MNIETLPVADLIPYARNARTHSDSQVAQLAASIREFGFCNPILIDAESGIIAGHGRLLAARQLGMDTVPCVRFESLPKSTQKNGVKDCICQDCGAEFTVRKDTNPVICRRCVSSRGGKSNLGRVTAKTKPCRHCGSQIRASKKDVFCSLECREANLKDRRECKYCKTAFTVRKSAIGPSTNASGNFCSRPCYEKWMCNTQRVTGRGSQWLKARTEAKRRHPFCALCGTTKNLQVHHVVPFRMTFDNSQSNLIPLCVKHHKIVETITHDIEHSGSDPRTMKLVIGSMLLERSLAVRSVIGGLINAR